MYEIQKFDVSPRIVLRKTPRERIKTLIRNSLLSMGVNFHGWRTIMDAQTARTNVKAYAISESELDEAKIRELAEYSRTRTVDYANVLEPLGDSEAIKTVQYTTVPLLRKLIAEAGDIATVADLGCYCARVIGLLPPGFPDIHWDFVDFMEDIVSINSAYAAPNTQFISGYPLHYLRGLDQPCDVVHFNRVLALVGRDEIKSYMRCLAEKARYVVLGEPAKILALPGDLALDDCADFIQFPGYRTYNYRKLLTEFGFELLHYDAVRTAPEFSGEQHFIVRAVARNPRL